MADEAKKAEIKEKVLQEGRHNMHKPRFGLFSYTMPNAILEDTYHIQKQARKDETGTVPVGPRNFQTTKVKKGKGGDAYFSTPTYASIGDPYQDQKKNQFRTGGKPKGGAEHDRSFKPSGPQPQKFPYEYQEEGAKKKTRVVTEDGGVPIAPKNFLTSPPKKGGATTHPGVLFEGAKYQGDDFDVTKEIAKKERAIHAEKLQDKPFYIMNHGNKEFFAVQNTYGKDENCLEQVERNKEVQIQKAEHQHQFKPSHPPKKGYNKTIAPFPEYKPETWTAPKRKEEPEVKPAPWKVTYTGLTRPQPSVQTNTQNLKKEFGSLKLH